jgi:hypothetical protein
MYTMQSVLPAGRNFSRKTQIWPHQNLRGRATADFFAYFSIKCPKSGRTFLKHVLYITALLIFGSRLINSLTYSTFLQLFSCRNFFNAVSTNMLFVRPNLAVEFGRTNFPGVGNIVCIYQCKLVV